MNREQELEQLETIRRYIGAIPDFFDDTGMPGEDIKLALTKLTDLVSQHLLMYHNHTHKMDANRYPHETDKIGGSL